MADVRSLLKNEREARRIQHKHASYSTTGSLICLLCHIQLKGDSQPQWDKHLRSVAHITHLQKAGKAAEASAPVSMKRKASDDEEGRSPERKRSKVDLSLQDGAFEPSSEEYSTVPAINTPISIPSRPATPMKALSETPTPPIPNVNEDEWAAFEADIAAAEVIPEAVISAPAMTSKELEARSLEESNARRKERVEAEMEGDKEDATRKMEDELEEMESLEERVRKLREKREALRIREPKAVVQQVETVDDAMDEDDDGEDDDDWSGFR